MSQKSKKKQWVKVSQLFSSAEACVGEVHVIYYKTFEELLTDTKVNL